MSELETTPPKWPAQNKWNRENPLALWAHQSLRSALKRGLVQRQPCARCGAEPAEFHHPDHRQPLVGEWLCRLHHRREHARLRLEGDV
jgi:hypothetical protein